METIRKLTTEDLKAGVDPSVRFFVYGNCIAIPPEAQTTAAHMLVLQDDFGHCRILVPTKLTEIRLSSSMISESLIVVNRSGQCFVSSDQNGPYIQIGGVDDIRFRTEAYQTLKELSGAAPAQAAFEVAHATVQVQEDASIRGEAKLRLEKAVESSLRPQEADSLFEQLPKYMREVAIRYSDCLDAAAVAFADFVHRNPSYGFLLKHESIQTVATSFFIEMNRKIPGAWGRTNEQVGGEIIPYSRLFSRGGTGNQESVESASHDNGDS